MDCARYTHQKRTETLSLLPLVILPPLLDADSLFQMHETWVMPALWIMLGQEGKQRKPRVRWKFENKE